MWIPHHLMNPDHGAVRHASDDGVEQRLLRLEVVVERAARGLELVEHVLDAHGLVALALDEPLGDVEEGLALDLVHCRIERPRHGRSITDRQSVYLWVGGWW